MRTYTGKLCVNVYTLHISPKIEFWQSGIWREIRIFYTEFDLLQFSIHTDSSSSVEKWGDGETEIGAGDMHALLFFIPHNSYSGI